MKVLENQFFFPFLCSHCLLSESRSLGDDLITSCETDAPGSVQNLIIAIRQSGLYNRKNIMNEFVHRRRILIQTEVLDDDS